MDQARFDPAELEMLNRWTIEGRYPMDLPDVDTAVLDEIWRRPDGSSRTSQGRVAETRSRASTSTLFLHRGLVLRATTGDGSVRHMRETPAQRYYVVRNLTIRDADHPAHNPKVAGSNPAPATKSPVQDGCRGGTHPAQKSRQTFVKHLVQ